GDQERDQPSGRRAGPRASGAAAVARHSARAVVSPAMRRGAVIALSALALVAATGELTAQVKNYEAPGNLESMNDIACAGSAKLQNMYTPADLYRAAELCIRRATYRDAAFLYALAGVYGRYDTLRVADRSAHQAITVLQMQAFGGLPPDRQEAFKR